MNKINSGSHSETFFENMQIRAAQWWKDIGYRKNTEYKKEWIGSTMSVYI